MVFETELGMFGANGSHQVHSLSLSGVKDLKATLRCGRSFLRKMERPTARTSTVEGLVVMAILFPMAPEGFLRGLFVMAHLVCLCVSLKNRCNWIPTIASQYETPKQMICRFLHICWCWYVLMGRVVWENLSSMVSNKNLENNILTGDIPASNKWVWLIDCNVMQKWPYFLIFY